MALDLTLLTAAQAKRRLLRSAAVGFRVVGMVQAFSERSKAY